MTSILHYEMKKKIENLENIQYRSGNFKPQFPFWSR